jgi:RNA polymerase sigma factor (sigma-70 family)
MDALSDEALMSRVKAGEIGFAGLLFERYQQRIYHYFLRTLSQPFDAQDATQTTFARLLNYRNTYRPDKKFSSWLFSIAVNQRNQQLTLLGRRNEEELDPVSIPTVDDGPTHALNRDQQRERLRLALAQLRPDEREILSLFLWEEHDYAELADIYQIKLPTLRVRIHRALKSLKQVMNAKGGLGNE